MRELKLPREYLEAMYDEIIREKIQTNEDYIETIYNRMTFQSQELMGENMKKYLKITIELKKGTNFVKYGRTGEPHPRRVFLNDREDRICW